MPRSPGCAATLLASAFVLCCSEPRIRVSAGEVVVSAERLDFPETYVGFSSRLVLGLRNEARSARTVTATVGAPFRVEPSELTLPGGSTGELTLLFQPTAVGSRADLLRLTVDAAAAELPLAGTGLAVARCEALPCKESRFNPASGRCVAAPVADGTGCDGADLCLVNARCQAGQCVGEARRCDDGNACTLDACDPGTGCVHSDRASSCAVPQDPCKAPLCDPVAGCTVVDAADGTRCGTIDCVTANICLAGSCRAVAPPDGFTCAVASPCQAKGVCQSQVCVRPPPQPLVPAWTPQLAAGRLPPLLGSQRRGGEPLLDGVQRGQLLIGEQHAGRPHPLLTERPGHLLGRRGPRAPTAAGGRRAGHPPDGLPHAPGPPHLRRSASLEREPAVERVGRRAQRRWCGSGGAAASTGEGSNRSPTTAAAICGSRCSRASTAPATGPRMESWAPRPPPSW